MTRSVRPTAACLLFLFAFVWPWDVYQYIPWLGVHATGLIALVLVGLLIADVFRTRQLRMPFELLWPAVLLLLLVTLSLFHEGSGVSFRHLGAVLVYAATVHFARSRERIEYWLWISCLSGACAALWTHLAFFAFPLPPTAYSLQTQGVLWFARDLPGGALTLAICGVMSLHFLIHAVGTVKDFGKAALALVSAALPFSALAFTLLPPRFWMGGWHWRPPEFGHVPGVTLAALLVLLWIIARAIAKGVAFSSLASKIERAPDDLEATPGVGVAVMIVTTLVVATLLCLCFPVRPVVAHAYLLGLAGAYVLPKKERQGPPPHWQYALLLPCAAVVALNLVHVYPENRSDPRNYDVAALADFDAGRFHDLARRMNIIEAFAPGERRTHLWRARVELSLGYSHRAALEFGRAVRGSFGGSLVLPPPSEAEQNEFLVRLRDSCSSARVPERMLAYEYALVATGRADRALDSLRHRVYTRRKLHLDLPARPFAEAIAFLLGDQALAGPLRQWSAAELLMLLKHWGATIERAPADFPPDMLPVVLAARAAPEWVAWCCQAGAANPAMSRTHARQPLGRPGDPGAGWGEAGWMALVKADGAWSTELRIPGGANVVEARFTQGGDLACTQWVVVQGLAPDLPALRIYIP